MVTSIAVDINQLIFQLILSISIGGLVGAGIFIGTTRAEIKHLKEEVIKTKAQLDKDIQSKTSLTESTLDGRIKVLESDLKNSKEQLERQRDDIKEQSRYLRTLGNRVTNGKLGLDDDD